ncbi:MAG: ppnK [Firmicutes bacterium]|nr:ppnK [Bacillota bacterium]
MFTIGVFPNTDKTNADLVLKRIVDFYKTKKVKLLLPQKAADELGYAHLGTENLLEEKIDIGLTIGGDGTLLNACRKVADRDIPVCGINIGRLGFLADIELAELESKLDKILNNDYRIEERLMIAAIIKREKTMTYVGSAINDIVVTKGGFARMLTLGLSIDDYLVANYQADGLIVSTSTGSTGYSLSAGGPIINPSLKLLLVTPICPHTLNARPMIISQDEEVRINIAASHTDIVLTFDGQDSYCLLPGDEVIVKKSPLIAQIIKFEDKNYYHTMRTKLWKGN